MPDSHLAQVLFLHLLSSKGLPGYPGLKGESGEVGPQVRLEGCEGLGDGLGRKTSFKDIE